MIKREETRRRELEPDTAQIWSPWQHNQAASRVGGRCGNVSLSTALQSKTPASLSMDPHRPAEQQAASRPQSYCALIRSLACGHTCSHTDINPWVHTTTCSPAHRNEEE